MSQFIETIKVLNGELKNLSYHQSRFNRTRTEIFGHKSHPDLTKEIYVPETAARGLFKCRILYSHQISDIEFQPYQKPVIRSLKLVNSDTISYPYKSAERSGLKELYERRGNCDDILIVKKGMITDSYIANVVFWDGISWFTPDTPLLEGTMREFLISRRTIKPVSIRIEDLSRYKLLGLINALNDWSDLKPVPVENISW